MPEERTGTTWADSRMLPENIPWPDGFQESTTQRSRKTPSPSPRPERWDIGHPAPAHQQPTQFGRGNPPYSDPGKRHQRNNRLHQRAISNGRSLPRRDISPTGNLLPNEDWRRERKTGKPLIRAKLLKNPGGRTRTHQAPDGNHTPGPKLHHQPTGDDPWTPRRTENPRDKIRGGIQKHPA